MSSYRIFGTKSSFALPCFREAGGVLGRGGQKKSLRALRAWRAKAGDHFFEIFFGSFFPSTGKKLNIHFQGQPTADKFIVVSTAVCRS